MYLASKRCWMTSSGFVMAVVVAVSVLVLALVVVVELVALAWVALTLTE